MNRFVVFATLLVVAMMSAFTVAVAQQKINYKDSIVTRIVYRDTIVHRYRYDTIFIKHYLHSDTSFSTIGATAVKTDQRKKHAINPNNWGIGPSVGLYYSPFHGADINIGFGVQYYFLAVPSFRNPHMGHRKKNR